MTAGEADAIRLAIGRLKTGASELQAIALVMPLFLAGAELAAEGFNAAGMILRDGIQRPMDRAVFVTFALLVGALALRARLSAGRAAALLPDALSDDRGTRAGARTRLQALAGPPFLRRAAEWIAAESKKLLLVLVGVVIVTSLLPIPNPVWIAVALAVLVAMDVRWRGMLADAADQLPP